MVLKEMGVLTMIYSYVADCRCCEVGYLIIIGLSLLFSNYSTYVFITFCFVFFYFYSAFFVLFFVLLCVLFLLLCCLFPIFVRVYRPLPPGGNPIAVNKYNVMK
jgi:hypothetical protein